MQTHLLDVVIIFILILINGILAMTELAIVSSNRIKMETLSKKNTGAKIALELMQNPGSFFSTIQIGITIIGIVSGAFGAQKFAEPMGEWLNTFNWMHNQGNIIAFSLVLFFITYISIVFGELIPKKIAITNPEKIASFFASPILLFAKITKPFVVALDYSSKKILLFFNQKESKEPGVTEEEIHAVMKEGLETGAIDNFEHKIFQKVLQFGDREASVIMTPKIKVVYLDLLDSLEENIKKIFENSHRYYPVFEGGTENFKGIIDTKDALKQTIKGNKLNFNTLIKKAPLVIEDNLGPDLLDQFKKYKTQIAIVVDEYGSMQGIITLIDLFETLIGTLPGSTQDKNNDIITREDGSWLCNGLSDIEAIEDLLKTEIVKSFEDSVFNTLAGFLLVNLKHVPKEGEYIYWKNFKFEIIDMDGTRIDKVLIQKNK